MTTYTFTWLQFVFPFYILLLVALIIVVSHYSGRFAKTFGNNPVSAFATLILLSYSKILHVVILALSSATLEYPDDINHLVWLYVTVPYFQRFDHIALGLFAIHAADSFPSIHIPPVLWPLASGLLTLACIFLAQQDKAIYGCLSCTIQERDSLLDSADHIVALHFLHDLCFE